MTVNNCDRCGDSSHTTEQHPSELDQLLEIELNRNGETSKHILEKRDSLISKIEQKITDGINYKCWYGILKLDYEKLEESRNFLEKERLRELKDNNELRETAMKYLKQKEILDKIDHMTLHAGCMGNENCNLCPIQKLLEELKD
jgi:hypothetical protein